MTYSALHAAAYLHHIELQSSNPERLAKFYGSAMQMQVEKQGDVFICRGPQRRLIVSKGQDKKLMMDEAFNVTYPEGNKILFGLAKKDPEGLSGLKGPTQHLTLATHDPEKIEAFYAGKLGFAVSDRVRKPNGEVATVFTRSNHEHHTLACFRSDRVGVDHHSYEAGDWNVIRDWCDHLATLDIQLMWGPGRHGPGNNLFIFIVDPDGNWIEISAELEIIHDRPVKEWPHAERTLNLWGKGILRS